MTDTELLDWLCGHPFVSRHDGLGDEEVTLTTFASIGRGRDFRAALRALIEHSETQKCKGLPNARERKERKATQGVKV